MPQMTDTVLLRGGLNLVTPPIATPAGQVTAAINYEPEVAGYRRIAGYERFDGQQAPSTGSTSNEMETLRDAIEKVPGVGPVRGVHVYNGAVYAFRDKVSGGGAMYKSSDDGWVEQTFGYTLDFVSGTAAFSEQDTLTGGTSGATATIERVVLTSGSFSDGDAAGFFVLSNLSGEFQASETITSASGSATNGAASEQAITLPSGGRYKFLNHNFYGAAKSARMYFANGTGTAFEWDGEVLAPIRTGSNAGGSPDAIEYLLETGGDNILTADGDKIIISRGELDTPNYIAEFHNHL